MNSSSAQREREHVCQSGPLCRYWHSSHSHHEDPGLCEHESCCAIVMEGCMACQIEANEADLECPQHHQPIASVGEYSGYAGGRCTYAVYACGCSSVDESDDLRAAR